jgi:hypothetical protein
MCGRLVDRWDPLRRSRFQRLPDRRLHGAARGLCRLVGATPRGKA